MKVIYLLILLYTLSIAAGCKKQNTNNYIRHVNLLLGTGPSTIPSAGTGYEDPPAYGHTLPAVTAPFGMTQWTPQTFTSEKSSLSPFYWGNLTLQGFRATHWTSGSSAGDYGSFTIFPTTYGNEFRFLPSQRNTQFIYDADNSTPAYFTAMFPEKNIVTEITATRRAGFLRFSWLEGSNATVIIDVNSDEGKGYIHIDPDKNEISGYNPVHGISDGESKPAGFKGYFVARFDHGFERSGTFAENELMHNVPEQNEKNNIGAYVTFKLAAGDALKMKMGTSFTSIENARMNLDEEIPHWDFEQTRMELEQEWNALLGKIEVQGGSDDDLSKFYTAMYHSLIHPRLYNDVNGEYPEFGSGNLIKVSKDQDYYCDFSSWSTFRAQMPLLSLIAPRQYEDMMRSLLLKAEQGDWLPGSPMRNSYSNAMPGDPTSTILADAVVKGFDVDPEMVYTFLRKNAFESPSDIRQYNSGKGRRSLDPYIQLGYVPAEYTEPNATHSDNPVAQTLEYAFNDWAVAQVAGKLERMEDYNELAARSLNYLNVYNPSTGEMQGKYGNGTFADEPVPGSETKHSQVAIPGEYTWYVPHDVDGLAELMGGTDKFNEKLVAFFENGGYSHRSVFGHHIPYLFNYTGNWQKTQETVKKLLQNEYSTGPGGLPGNDESGQLSAWYVFSAMGLYPVCPGSNNYQLSSPVFEKVTLHLDKAYYPGREFILEADPGNQYGNFSSVRLNGADITPAITHQNIKNGGKLEFIK